MVNFGLLAAEIGSSVWGTPVTFNGFRVLAALLRGRQVVSVSQTLRVEQRVPVSFFFFFMVALCNRADHIYFHPVSFFFFFFFLA